MNIELKKQRNDLLKRTNVLAKINSVNTPSRVEVLAKVAAMLGVDEKLIVLNNIEQNFGEHVSVAYLKVYDDIEVLKKLEPKHKLKRSGLEEKLEPKKEVKEEKPKEEVKEEEEKPKEEVKEEKTEEVKEEEEKPKEEKEE